MNPRRIKTPKLGSGISSVPSAAATVLCPHITKDVKFLERDQRILLKKEIQWLENKPYGGKFHLPQLLRENVWNGLLLCVEELALDKDI